MGLVRSVSLVAATMSMGLIAGVFYAYSCSVMLALAQSDDRTFIDVMQRINVAIQNGWFALSFMGALLFTGLSAVLLLSGDGRSALLPVVAALVLYIVAMVITFGFNIPLNNELSAAGRPDRIPDPAAVRRHFESAWVGWNLARALASTAAFGCLCWGLVLYGRIGA